MQRLFPRCRGLGIKSNLCHLLHVTPPPHPISCHLSSRLVNKDMKRKTTNKMQSVQYVIIILMSNLSKVITHSTPTTSKLRKQRKGAVVFSFAHRVKKWTNTHSHTAGWHTTSWVVFGFGLTSVLKRDSSVVTESWFVVYQHCPVLHLIKVW